MFITRIEIHLNQLLFYLMVYRLINRPLFLQLFVNKLSKFINNLLFCLLKNTFLNLFFRTFLKLPNIKIFVLKQNIFQNMKALLLMRQLPIFALQKVLKNIYNVLLTQEESILLDKIWVNKF